MLNLNNKYFIVSGSAGGNGTFILKRIKDFQGFVIAIDKNNENLKKLDFLTKKDFKINLDINDIKEVDLFIKFIDKKIGKSIGGLVNNAGITLPSLKNNEISLDNFKNTLNTNFFSAINLTNKIHHILKKNKNGSIINITSLGSKLGMKNNPSYQLSKNLVFQLTKSQAFDYGKFNIRVNSICPGYIKTPMTKKSYDDQKRRKAISNRTILNRWGDPIDVANTVIFLISDLSKYITGTEIIVDGGWLAKGI